MIDNLPNRIRTKNEVTGMRIVSQYVQEFWECGWQPLDARNDRGIDGVIFMRQRNIDLGVKVNVQIKCGSKYISSENKEEIRISIDSESGLLQHIEYWRIQNEPTVLIFVNPSLPKRDKNGNILRDLKGQIIWVENRLTAKAWWVDLKSDNLKVEDKKTLISIPKKNLFGEHSKGEFQRLIKPLISKDSLPIIQLNSESKNLLHSTKLKTDSRSFYKNWKNNNVTFCQSLGKEIIVSKTGWNHILSAKRSKERRGNSLKLLGVARQIIQCDDAKFYLLNQSESLDILEQKFGIRARYKDKFLGEQVVQVIILRKLNLKNQKEKLWFYSIHYRR
ncbi:MAG: DUF4365 domain-containing protein [Flavobacterium sp.]|nr:MAG: DUF4365 domain-containing protein [Flavobacterium sp.]